MLHHSIDFGRVAYAGMRFLVEYPDGGCGCMDFNKVSKKILTNLRRFSFFFFFFFVRGYKIRCSVVWFPQTMEEFLGLYATLSIDPCDFYYYCCYYTCLCV